MKKRKNALPITTVVIFLNQYHCIDIFILFRLFQQWHAAEMQMNAAETQMKSKSLSLCKNVMNFVSKSNVISCYNALPCFDLFKVWMRWRLSFATAHMIKVVRWFVLTSPCFANRPLANFVRSGECARLRMVFTNQLKSRACAFSIKVCLIKYWLCKY